MARRETSVLDVLVRADPSPADSTYRSAAYRRWINSAYWLVLNLGTRGAGLIRSLLIARLLPPEGASLGFLAVSVGAAAQASLASGTTQILVAEKDVDEEIVTASWWLELLKALLLSSALVVAGFAAKFGSATWNSSTLFLAALIPFATGLLNPEYRLWERSGQHGRVVLVTAAGTAGGVVLLAILLLFGAGWWAVPVGVASGQLVTVVLSHRFGLRLPRRSVNWTAVIKLFGRGAPFIVIGLASYFSSLGVDLLLALFGAVAWVAPYRLSVALVHTVLSALPAVVARASLSEDAERSRTLGHRAGISLPTLAFVSAATVFLVPLCYTLLPSLAAWLYGTKWSETALLIPPLTISVGLRSLSWPFTSIFMATQNYGTEARLHLIEAALGALAIGSLVHVHPTLGIWVAALVALGGLVVRNFMLLRLLPHGARSAALISATAVAGLLLPALAAQVIDKLAVPLLVASAAPAAAAVWGASRWARSERFMKDSL